ncbi:DASS family sodium-coupled anion symporter [Lentibacillus halophilus]|uniref:Sodium-dependent dicarboxylate transporter SdcS n=1 Tax=Lentibacillus halophilus TaxID=295065 RepID=A0ABP3J320_9BACI
MSKQITLLTIVCAIYAVFFTSLWDWNVQVQAFAVLLIIQILWIGRVFPLAVSSLMLIVLLSIHFLDYDAVLDEFGSSLVWLLFATFILSHAFIQTGLANRISLGILDLAKGSVRLLLAVSFVMMFVLTVFIPSNIGKGSLISSTLDDLLSHLQRIQETSNIGKSLFIGTAYVSSIAAAFVPTGASSTIYAFGMLSDVSADMTYVTWLLLFVFPVGLFVGGLWLLFMKVFPAEHVDRAVIADLIQTKKQEMGSWSTQEMKMAGIIGFTLALWLSQSLHGFSIPQVGLFGAVLTVLPYIGVMSWDEAKKGINWDMMIFFASTLMLAHLLLNTGVLDTVSGFMVARGNDWPAYVIVIGLIGVIAILRVVFVNVLGFMTIMLPLAITAGEQIDGLSPLIIGMGVYLACVPGFLLVTQSPVHLITYSYGHYTDRDLLRVGSVSMLMWLVVIFLSVFGYWQWVV